MAFAISRHSSPDQIAAALRYMRSAAENIAYLGDEVLAVKETSNGTIFFKISRGLHDRISLPWGQSWSLAACPAIVQL